MKLEAIERVASGLCGMRVKADIADNELRLHTSRGYCVGQLRPGDQDMSEEDFTDRIIRAMAMALAAPV